jgi:hypothetical protein
VLREFILADSKSECAGFCYHSSDDVAGNIPTKELQRTVSMHAYFLDKADAAERTEIELGVPTNWRNGVGVVSAHKHRHSYPNFPRIYR